MSGREKVNDPQGSFQFVMICKRNNSKNRSLNSAFADCYNIINTKPLY